MLFPHNQSSGHLKEKLIEKFVRVIMNRVENSININDKDSIEPGGQYKLCKPIRHCPSLFISFSFYRFSICIKINCCFSSLLFARSFVRSCLLALNVIQTSSVLDFPLLHCIFMRWCFECHLTFSILLQFIFLCLSFICFSVSFPILR